MRCFYAAETEGHDPHFRLTNGRLHRNAERAERGRLLLDGLARLDLTTEEPPEAPRVALSAVHTEAFLTFLETAWDAWQRLPDPGEEVVPNAFAQRDWAHYPDSIVGRAGWHLGDTSAPIGRGTWTAARRAADTAIAAADAVLEGAGAAYALCRPPGHHTDTQTAAGHCMMNVAALAAERLRSQHDRVAILDIDVHHGNGTQAIFYDRDDVLFVSIHADPSDYYPFFAGYADETGAGAGAGHNLNMPLPRSTGDAEWLAALDRAIDRIAGFAPGALVVSLGLDAHENDPLMGMQVTFDGFRRAGATLASRLDLPILLVQEGGYVSADLSTSLASFLGGFTGRTPNAA